MRSFFTGLLFSCIVINIFSMEKPFKKSKSTFALLEIAVLKTHKDSNDTSENSEQQKQTQKILFKKSASFQFREEHKKLIEFLTNEPHPGKLRKEFK